MAPAPIESQQRLVCQPGRSPGPPHNLRAAACAAVGASRKAQLSPALVPAAQPGSAPPRCQLHSQVHTPGVQVNPGHSPRAHEDVLQQRVPVVAADALQSAEEEENWQRRLVWRRQEQVPVLLPDALPEATMGGAA